MSKKKKKHVKYTKTDAIFDDPILPEYQTKTPLPCLNCGRELNGARVFANENVAPQPGAVTVCFHCGHLMVFTRKLRFRDLTWDELKEVAGDKRILAIQHMRVQKK